MKITFYGHVCIGIEINGRFILVDPFISANPYASHIDLESIKADYILLTHTSRSRLDVEQIAKRCESKVISNFEIVTHFLNWN